MTAFVVFTNPVSSKTSHGSLGFSIPGHGWTQRVRCTQEGTEHRR